MPVDRDTAPDHWVTVYAGSMSGVRAVQSLLEGAGIATFVPDENLKTFDPFITGANPLGMELKVPSRSRSEAEELLAHKPSASADDEPAAPPLSDAEREQARVEKLGVTIRWCCFFLAIGWIVGAWLGFGYLRAARALPRRPDQHGLTVFAWMLQIVLAIALFVVPNFWRTTR